MNVPKMALKAGLAKLGARIPINVKHLITYRCNLNCKYCVRHDSDHREMTTKQVKDCMAAFRKMGTDYWSFSGGEPLLREDLGELIAFAAELRMKCSVTSNGVLVPRRLEDLRGLFQVTISIDGPNADIHDSIRGKGNFERAVTALEVLRSEGIPRAINTVITSTNVKVLGEMIDFARAYDCLVTFVPVCAAEAHDPRTLANVSDYLVRRKKAGEPIAHTLTYLRYLADYPRVPRERCWYGRAFCAVCPDGQVAPCAQIYFNKHTHGMTFPSGLELGWRGAFGRLRGLLECPGCFACYTEYNIALNHPLEYLVHAQAFPKNRSE